jgi:addiction module HigA family antidote
MSMKNPSHPGELVWHDCIEPMGLTTATAAEALGVTRQALNNVVSGKSRISPEMAVRLSKAFGSSPETWLRMQMNYDLAQLKDIRVKRVKPVRLSVQIRRGRPAKRQPA